MPTSEASQVVLITGGAVRVGRAIVEAFASRGYAVAIHANRSLEQANELSSQLSQQGVPTLVVQAELREETAVRGMIDQVVARFGRLDVLVNNAAIWSPRPLEEVTADEVREYFEINSLATFIACQHAGLKMVEQATGGVIINIGDWSIARPYPDYAAYFPSKGTIPTMTRMFAVELSRRNPRIRVNAILPGPVIFPPDLPESARRLAIESTLVQRAGSPENVAHAAIFLVENDFVTGVCLPVDGGRTIGS